MLVKFLLAALSGLFTGLSFNYPVFSVAVWGSLIPLIFAIRKCTFKECIFVGVVFAVLYYGVAIFWIAYVTRLGLFFLLVYLSLYCIVFTLLSKFLLGKPLRVLSIPCLWVILEFLKENIWCGFGWANLSYSQYQNLHLIQTADLFGAKFISFLIVIVNILLWEIVLCFKNCGKKNIYRKRILAKTSLILLIFLLSFIYSNNRLNSFPSNNISDKLNISIVQPNIPQELKWQRYATLTILDRLDILSQKAEEDTLLIFPEAAWPYVIDSQNYKILQSFIKETGKDILIGAVTKEGYNFYNSALLFDKNAKLIDSYRKINLVPFGEYVPMRDFFSFISVFNSIGDISKGSKATRFSYKGKIFSVLICFEDIFPEFTSNTARNSDFLINITNDAWFHGEPQAGQHLGIMTFRAIENRIAIVRSANTGISGWVSAQGKIERFQKKSKFLFTSGVQSFFIPLSKERSFYNGHGEILPIFCALFLLFIIVKDKVLRDKG